MTAAEHAANIGAQINQQAIASLIQSFAAQSAEFDKCREALAEKEKELAALKAKREPPAKPKR